MPIAKVQHQRELISVPAKDVENIPVEEEMSESFMAYALSVITSRALPDVRDGLKPVQRRVLWSMLGMGIRPNTPYRKCARIVGDTMGRYHPHGDAAIYDTLVRMGQDFSRMATLIQPQGNFGSLDDPPAASRYTECRLTEVAMDMVREVDEGTVDFRPTYDGEAEEPVVLPAAFPNLLVNGTTGIAVGMATNMLPHSLREVAAAIELVMQKQEDRRLRKPRPTIDELLEVIPGPDFPGGGTVIVGDALREGYETGRGSVMVRAKVHLESLTRSKKALIFTELPPSVGAERVIARVSKLMEDNKLPSVASASDLSDIKGLRLQITLKTDADPNKVLSDLYDQTPLQETASINNVVLDNDIPVTLGIIELCEHYILHRLDVIVRRTQYRLRKAEERLHIVAGLLIALANIDEVVALIKKSRNTDTARKNLMSAFKLSEIQASHILEMPLRRLTSLEVKKLKDEAAELRKAITDYQDILKREPRRRDIVRSELHTIVEKHGIPRRAVLQKTSTIRLKAVNADGSKAKTLATGKSSKQTSRGSSSSSKCVVTISTNGNVGTMPLKDPSRKPVVGRHDLVASRVIVAQSASVGVIAPNGSVYVASVGELPEATNRGRGMSSAEAFGMPPKTVPLGLVFPSTENTMVVTAKGKIKRMNSKAILQQGSGKPVIRLQAADKVVAAFSAPANAEVLFITAGGYSKRVKINQFKIANPNVMGIQGIKLRAGDSVVSAGAVLGDESVVMASNVGNHKAIAASEIPLQSPQASGLTIASLANREKLVDGCVTSHPHVLAVASEHAQKKKAFARPITLPIERSKRTAALEKHEHHIISVGVSRY